MLLLTLWIIVVLSLLVYSLTYQMQLEIKLTSISKKQFQARALAQAALAKGIVDLKNDLVIQQTDPKQRFDAEGDVWARPEEDKKNIEIGNGKYTCVITDEESKINLNTTGQEVMQAVIEYLGYDTEYARKIGAAILDWSDWDDNPRTGEGKSEREEYAKLKAEWNGEPNPEEAVPLQMKNDSFLTVEELLQVPGVTYEMFFGIPEPGKEHDDFRRHPPADRNDIVGLRDLLTVDSEGVVNINTATPHVLAALLLAGGAPISEVYTLAKDIVEYRRDGQEEDITNDKVFRAVSELKNVQDLSEGVISQMQRFQRLSTISFTFNILGIGEVKDVRKTVKVLVRRNWQQYNIVETKENENQGDQLKGFRDEDRTNSLVQEPEVRIIHWREI